MDFTRHQPLVADTPEATAEGVPWGKRAIDVGFALAAIPLLAFCTLLVGAVMALFAPGPVLFCQPRVGFRGRRFLCYKFRTMQVGSSSKARQGNCDELNPPDPPGAGMGGSEDLRLIPGGRLLRASGLAELPQAINVLRGEMSLVGPRPLAPYENEKCLLWQRARCQVAPGLIGLWQVAGRKRITFDEMVRLDLEYAERRSFWLDLTIVIRAVPALFSASAAPTADSRWWHRTGDLRARESAPEIPTPDPIQTELLP